MVFLLLRVVICSQGFPLKEVKGIFKIVRRTPLQSEFSYRTGTLKKTAALRADILTTIHIYRMDIKTKKERT
jgi:hypothetical protein